MATCTSLPERVVPGLEQGDRLLSDADAPDHQPADQASLTRLRGATLLEALAIRLPEAISRSDVAFAVATALAEAAPEPDRALIGEAARLQEVGKLFVAMPLLRRSGSDLSQAEREQLAEHFEHGHRVALGAGIPVRACGWILHARERWDGGGPGSLGGGEIPLASRIIAVSREYLDAPTPPGEADERTLREAAATHLQSLAGEILDPTLVARAVELGGDGGGSTN